MVDHLVTAISSLCVVVSVLLLAQQTRDLVKQTKLNNEIGILGGFRDALEMVHRAQMALFEKPVLRPYFYDGKPCPRRGRRRAEVLAVAEAWLDAIDYALTVVEVLPGSEHHESWRDYAHAMLQSSPAISECFEAHQDWYLALWRHEQPPPAEP